MSSSSSLVSKLEELQKTQARTKALETSNQKISDEMLLALHTKIGDQSIKLQAFRAEKEALVDENSKLRASLEASQNFLTRLLQDTQHTEDIQDIFNIAPKDTEHQRHLVEGLLRSKLEGGKVKVLLADERLKSEFFFKLLPRMKDESLWDLVGDGSSRDSELMAELERRRLARASV